MARAVLSCSVGLELAMRLTHFAELKKVPVSFVVQTAVERFLNQDDTPTEVVCNEDGKTPGSDH